MPSNRDYYYEDGIFFSKGSSSKDMLEDNEAVPLPKYPIGVSFRKADQIHFRELRTEHGRVILTQIKQKCLVDYLSSFYSVLPEEKDDEYSMSHSDLLKYSQRRLRDKTFTEGTNLVTKFGLPRRNLGYGGFATTYKFITIDKTYHVVKYITLDPRRFTTFEKIHEEYLITRDLDPKLFGVGLDIFASLKDPYHIMFVQKFIEGKDLISSIESNPRFQNPEFSFQVFKTIANSVHILHEQYNICHSDLKPENIMFDSDTDKIKIIDFGMSFRMDLPITSYTNVVNLNCGTPGYYQRIRSNDLEYELDYNYIGRAKDMFSLGHTFFNMLSYNNLWDNCSMKDVAYAKYYKTGRLLEYENLKRRYYETGQKEKLQQVVKVEIWLRYMMQLNVSARLTFYQMITDEWFRRIPTLHKKLPGGLY
ncbi:kinase-like domain-containing protein [Scheffersomyces coipomensis]|uniref:kinase-like domain-containing protein n=1 Tax=Scheffersomyces coipomensis TaxID=1788519 RepID=UPI00315D36E9